MSISHKTQWPQLRLSQKELDAKKSQIVNLVDDFETEVKATLKGFARCERTELFKLMRICKSITLKILTRDEVTESDMN